MWKEVIEKADDVEAKSNLEPMSYIYREFNSKCLKDHCLLIKKNKKVNYWEDRNEVSKDKEKAKSYNPFFINQS